MNIYLPKTSPDGWWKDCFRVIYPYGSKFQNVIDILHGLIPNGYIHVHRFCLLIKSPGHMMRQWIKNIESFSYSQTFLAKNTPHHWHRTINIFHCLGFLDIPAIYPGVPNVIHQGFPQLSQREDKPSTFFRLYTSTHIVQSSRQEIYFLPPYQLKIVKANSLYA